MILKKCSYFNSLKNKNCVFFGAFARWPDYHQASDPTQLAKRLGALVDDQVSPELDYLIIGSKRQKGKADAIRRAAKLQQHGQSAQILQEDDFLYLLRPDIRGLSFAFTGGFEFCPAHVSEGKPYAVVELAGAEFKTDVDETLDYLVVGERRAKGKAAMLRKAEQLKQQGHALLVLDEYQFLELIACQLDPHQIDFQALIVKLYNTVNPRRLQSALKMLKAESFQLFSDLSDDQLVGIVHSQSGYSEGYSCALDAEGHYNCIDDDLNGCMSQQGFELCKHLLVLVLGLVYSGQLDAPSALAWLKAGSVQKPSTSEDLLAQTWLRYKGVAAGSIDWRPTETTPEDYYAF